MKSGALGIGIRRYTNNAERLNPEAITNAKQSIPSQRYENLESKTLCTKESVAYFEFESDQVDRARTHMSDVRNFAVGSTEVPPRALQTSECNELLDPTRTSCLILVQRQPGKLPSADNKRDYLHANLSWRWVRSSNLR